MKAVDVSALRLLSVLTLLPITTAWTASPSHSNTRHVKPSSRTSLFATSSNVKMGSLHGQNACFLPLKQMDQDSFAPRIIQIAGAYPGITREEFFAVSSEPSPEKGQWTYDFSDPDGPQLGTVAMEGSQIVASCKDPVVIIAEHPTLGVQLPAEIDGAVDLIVLVDRAKNVFGERKFLVLNLPGEGLSIQAFGTKDEMPDGAEILGQVDVVQIPWLPAMTPTKTGFMECDEYF